MRRNTNSSNNMNFIHRYHQFTRGRDRIWSKTPDPRHPLEDLS